MRSTPACPFLLRNESSGLHSDLIEEPLPLSDAPTADRGPFRPYTPAQLSRLARTKSVGDRPGRHLSTRSHAEFVADPLDVTLGSALGDEQPAGDLPVGHPGGNHR